MQSQNVFRHERDSLTMIIMDAVSIVIQSGNVRAASFPLAREKTTLQILVRDT